MPPEDKEFALRRFIICRLNSADYMATHTLKDIRRDAKRRRFCEGFDHIFDEVVEGAKK
jgi:hypothetical protein